MSQSEISISEPSPLDEFGFTNNENVQTIEEVLDQFQITTTTNRILDFHIPKLILNGNQLVRIPETLRQKSVHYFVDSNGVTQKAAWINKSLAHYLNSKTFTGKVRANEIKRALDENSAEITSLVKDKLLKNRKGPAGMGFVFANENVPKKGLVISEDSFKALCKKDNRWTKAKKVIVIRYPNLGPRTTIVLDLVVNAPLPFQKGNYENLGNKCPVLQSLLTEEVEEIPNSLDGLWLHPSVLKDCLEGDADGDLIYFSIFSFGKTCFKDISLNREPAKESTNESFLETIYKKANRIERKDLSKWLEVYNDNIPIGPATYACKFHTYQKAKELQGKSNHPFGDAWKIVAPESIVMMEITFDIRKSTYSEKVINKTLETISQTSKLIDTKKKEGDWFAITVVSNNIGNVNTFVKTFPNLQDFIDKILFQKRIDVLGSDKP